MPEDGLATETVAVIEQPTEQVAETMDDAADKVADAAKEAAESGNDALANKLSEVETLLRGHLQHHADEDALIEQADTVEEVIVPESVVKPEKVHWYSRLRFL